MADASDYKFEPQRFDLIVLFYYLDCNLFPKIVSALKPDGLLLGKMALLWSADVNSSSEGKNPSVRNELPSLVPGLRVLHHMERPVRNRGVAEFVARKVGK